MVKVVANQRGYYGGELREEGERFEIPDEIWNGNPPRRPSWVRLAAFGGKGDHDGDGRTGGAVKAEEPEKPKRGRKPKEEETADQAAGNIEPDWLPSGLNPIDE